jgi:hypothetical protein
MIRGYEVVLGALLATAAWAVLALFTANFIDLSRVQNWQTLIASILAIGGVAATAM